MKKLKKIQLKKAWIAVVLPLAMLCLAGMLTSCGDPATDEAKGFISGTDLSAAFTDIDAYKGYDTAFYGKVFSKEDDGTSTYLQVWQDYINSNNNAIVIYPALTDIGEGDYVYVEGRILGQFEGENAFGGKVTAMKINATKLKRTSYMDLIVPTKRSVDVNETKTQKGYSLTVQKVEFADTETRIYLKAENNGKSTFDIYTYSAKVKQGKNQYEQKDNFDADYKSLSSEIMQDAEDEGIILFPALAQKDFTLIIGASSDDWKEDIKDYKFNIKVAD